MDNFKRLAEKSIIIYGAGKVGKTVIEKITFAGYKSTISAIAVSEKNDNPENILDIPVMSIEELVDKAPKCIVIVATMEDKHLEIREHLLSLGFHRVYYVNDNIYKNWLNHMVHARYINPYVQIAEQLRNDHMISVEKMEQLRKNMVLSAGINGKADIPRLVVVLGTKCTLKCKECNNLMPHFKPQKDLDKNKIIQSLKVILNSVQTILICELIGGEPFLSDNLKDVIELLINKKNVFQIEITTNGTVLPRPILIRLLQNPKIKIRISDYGMLADKDRLISFLQENNIKYGVLDLGNWISSGGVEKRMRNKKELKNCYRNCSSGYYCKTMFDGKLFSCARAASLYSLGYMKEKEFIEMENKVDSNRIREFLMKDYSEACDYCDMGCKVKKIIEPAEQIK